MTRLLPLACALLWMAGADALAGKTARAPGFVASDHPDASTCGTEVMGRGGNAVDAIVATALCAGVVQPAGSGLGGGGFAVVVTPDGERHTFDFREVAPSAAHPEMFLDAQGEPVEGASNVGGLAVAVPSESRGLAALLAAHGRLPPKVVAQPAIRLASRGFRVGTHLVQAVARESSEEVKAEMAVDGRPVTHGDLLRRPALARTIKRWAATKGEDLHTGRGAEALVAHVQSHDGLITAEDVSGYQLARRAPVVVPFAGHTIVSMAPPSSGGVLLAQMLRVLDGLDPDTLERGSAAYLHRLAETMAHAYADRVGLGDPQHPDVDVDALLAEAHIERVRGDFDPARSFPPEHYGAGAPPPDDAGTQHLAAVDADGLAVALTTTVNTSFGSGLVVPELGIVLNDEMDDFATVPGRPNAFGLIQGDANAVRPGRRPLSSMTPTIVLDGDGEPMMIVGASGGSTIITGVLQVILDVLWFDVDPATAVAAPRIHHQWRPDRIYAEPGHSPDVLDLLRARGHEVRVWPGFTSVQVLVRGEDGLWTGASDPRKGGSPSPHWPD